MWSSKYSWKEEMSRENVGKLAGNLFEPEN
jgi:hypothetical protein